jgi:hypothetical protein
MYLLVLATGANAADVGITAKKLLLKSTPKLVLLSKDALVVPGANGSSSDPRCVADGGSGLGGSVKLSNGVDTVTLSMPCANWSTNGAGTLYKYKDTTGAPKVGKVKAGLLKVVSASIGGFPLPILPSGVNVEVKVGADTHCMTFDSNNGFPATSEKLLVRDAPVGSCMSTCLSSGGQFVGGYCWYLGAAGESCDTTCAALGLSCHPATQSYAGHPGGSLTRCDAVLEALTGMANQPSTCGTVLKPSGCSSIGSWCYDDMSTTSCADSEPAWSRACACG